MARRNSLRPGLLPKPRPGSRGKGTLHSPDIEACSGLLDYSAVPRNFARNLNRLALSQTPYFQATCIFRHAGRKVNDVNANAPQIRSQSVSIVPTSARVVTHWATECIELPAAHFQVASFAKHGLLLSYHRQPFEFMQLGCLFADGAKAATQSLMPNLKPGSPSANILACLSTSTCLRVGYTPCLPGVSALLFSPALDLRLRVCPKTQRQLYNQARTVKDRARTDKERNQPGKCSTQRRKKKDITST